MVAVEADVRLAVAGDRGVLAEDPQGGLDAGRHVVLLERVAVDVGELARARARPARFGPGVNLERQVGTIARKIAAKVATGAEAGPVTVEASELETYLGPARFKKEITFRTSRPGVATGVAWTLESVVPMPSWP